LGPEAIGKEVPINRIAEKKLTGNLKAILLDAIRIQDEVTSQMGIT